MPKFFGLGFDTGNAIWVNSLDLQGEIYFTSLDEQSQQQVLSMLGINQNFANLFLGKLNVNITSSESLTASLLVTTLRSPQANIADGYLFYNETICYIIADRGYLFRDGQNFFTSFNITL